MARRHMNTYGTIRAVSSPVAEVSADEPPSRGGTRGGYGGGV